MPGNAREDSTGYLGSEDVTLKEALRCLAASIEQLAKSEGSEAVELARGKAQELLDRLQPLIVQSTNARTNLEEMVRQRPLLAVALAGVAGFLLASLRRR